MCLVWTHVDIYRNVPLESSRHAYDALVIPPAATTDLSPVIVTFYIASLASVDPSLTLNISFSFYVYIITEF